LSPEDEGMMKRLWKVRTFTFTLIATHLRQLRWNEKNWAAKKVVFLGEEISYMSDFSRATRFEEETITSVRMLSLLRHFQQVFFKEMTDRRLVSQLSRKCISAQSFTN